MELKRYNDKDWFYDVCMMKKLYRHTKYYKNKTQYTH